MYCRKSLQRRWLGVLGVAALLLSAGAVAHQQKTALTRILFNANSGNIELMHRFYLHDADHVSGQLFGAASSLAESPETRDLFTNYVHNRFALEALDEEGGRVELSGQLIGSEIEGPFFWVYQELSDPGNLTGLTVIDLVLRDVWPDQSNLVNVEKNGSVYSMTFSGETELQSVSFQ